MVTAPTSGTGPSFGLAEIWVLSACSSIAK